MRPNVEEFQRYVAFDQVSRTTSGLRPSTDLLNTAKFRIKSLIEEDRASLEFITAYLENLGAVTEGMEKVFNALDSNPPEYLSAWTIFQNLHVNEVGAVIGRMLNLYSQDIS
jgi:hypothetical protein